MHGKAMTNIGIIIWAEEDWRRGFACRSPGFTPQHSLVPQPLLKMALEHGVGVIPEHHLE